MCQHFYPVHPRHNDIKKNKIGPYRPYQIKSRLPVLRAKHLISLFFKLAFKNIKQYFFVFHQHDFYFFFFAHKFNFPSNNVYAMPNIKSAIRIYKIAEGTLT